MMKTLVIAPHADDELLGCGGTLLRRRAEGADVGWIIVTAMVAGPCWSKTRIDERQREVSQVCDGLGIRPENVFEFRLPTTQLDQVPSAELVRRISDVIKRFEPVEMLVPHAYDIHSDHRLVSAAAAACSKWFRYPSVRRVLTYETISETDFSMRPEEAFWPNYYIDISDHLDRKIELVRMYKSELGDHPFPRSETALRALAQLRGAQSGFSAAEAFMLLRERV